MQAFRIHAVVEEEGQLRVTGLPLPEGQHVELIVLPEPTPCGARRLAARELLQSPIVGLLEDRTDLEDSPEYARSLREQAQERRR